VLQGAERVEFDLETILTSIRAQTLKFALKNTCKIGMRLSALSYDGETKSQNIHFKASLFMLLQPAGLVIVFKFPLLISRLPAFAFGN
jgi:hypothetical protein